MLRSALGKVAWVGRTASMVFGLALVLALVFGVATTALSATGGNFILGKANGATSVSKLTASVAGPALTLVNQSTEAAATALNINVDSGNAPLKVNAAAGTATNLSADELDGRDSSDFYAEGSKVADAIHAEQADSATNAQNAANADTLDGQDSPALLNGQLIDTRVGSHFSAPNNATGYINVLSNYTPPVNATAASFVRCAYDGSAVGQRLVIRAAQRSPSGSGGSVTIGGSLYLPVTTPGPNMAVLNQNSDTFHLNAGQSYDFGVNVADTAPTPSGGSETDYCTATVLIFRR